MCLANFKGHNKGLAERGHFLFINLLRPRSIQSKDKKWFKQKQMSTIPQLNKLTLGPLLTTSKGAKQIRITNDGGPLIWTPKEYLDVPF